MSDLRGYTRFAEHGDPAHVMEVLNGYLARMTEIVIAHGGTINEFIGDAIFAIFGAPLAHPDHAERAAATALAMQRAMDEINADHAARGLPRFEMGIGLNTGEAVVGNIGSEQRAKYAVVGSAVNVAARVEGATVGGQIFMTTSTYEAIAAIAEVAPPLAIEVKGLSEPLVLHELRGIGGRFAQRLAERGDDGPAVSVELPFVGAIIDGKVVRDDRIDGLVERLGRREVEVRLSVALAPLTNVRFRLTYPALGHASADLYGKVVGVSAEAPSRVRIRLTSVDPADDKILASLLAG
jgi:adenylate cyclase